MSRLNRGAWAAPGRHLPKLRLVCPVCGQSVRAGRPGEHEECQRRIDREFRRRKEGGGG